MCIYTCRNFNKCPQYVYCHHHNLCTIRLNCLFLNTAGTVNTTNISYLEYEGKSLLPNNANRIPEFQASPLRLLYIQFFFSYPNYFLNTFTSMHSAH